jgi:hypothetical protein
MNFLGFNSIEMYISSVNQTFNHIPHFILKKFSNIDGKKAFELRLGSMTEKFFSQSGSN